MIDAFGHSAGNAALFSDFGFEILFYGRLSHDLQERYAKE
jgi:hypothetical protein